MSIDSVVNVNVVLQGSTISQAGFGTVLIMTDTGDWPAELAGEDIATYATLAEMVDAGWSSTDKAYEAAAVMLSQKLPPDQWKVGRGAAATSQVNQFAVTGSTDADFTITLDGTAFTFTCSGDSDAQVVTGLAALINASLAYTCPDPAPSTTLTVTSSFPGTVYNVSVTNVNTELTVGTQTDADSSAFRLTDSIFGEDSDWYGLISTIRAPEEVFSLGKWTEANKRLYVAQLASAGSLIASNTLNAAYFLKSFSFARTAFLYHSDNDQYADAGWIAGKLSVNPDNRSTTWAHYTIKGAPVDSLTSGEQNALEGFNANYYVTLGGSGSTYKGTTADGTFIDNVLAADWYRTRLIEIHQARFSEYSNAGKKIPYTDSGIAIVGADVKDVTQRGINAGHFLKRPATDDDTASPIFTLPTRAEVSAVNVTNRTYTYEVEVVLAGAIHALTVTGYLPLA